MAQRGIAENDLDLIMWIGTEVEGGCLVREKDVEALARDLKHFLQHAKKLVGKRMVIAGDQIVTAYHVDRGKQRRLLRSARDRSSIA